MSWSFSATGKPAAVRAKASEHFTPTRLRLEQPEMNIALKIGEAIDAALDKMPSSLPVNVEASGSQSRDETGVANTLRLTIEPVWGFVE
ncbi:MAG: hypothetical protein JO266_18245 [Acidobacteria bacterium]|nr:hypothetical protein [Acidobacteriota bacterium]